MNQNSTKNTQQNGYHAITFDDISRDVTTDYLDSLDPNNPPKPNIIRSELLQSLNNEIALYNAAANGRRIPYPRILSEAQIADILLRIYPIINIDFAGSIDGVDDDDKDTDTMVLGIYNEDSGIYSTSDKTFYNLIEQYRYNLKDRDLAEIMKILSKKAPIRQRCSDRDIIIVNNGIFDYKTKRLLPFSPDYVFTSKSKVNYNPNAVNVIIHNNDDGTDWDVESWVDSLSDDPEIVELLWQIIGAVVRPYNAWDKAIMLYCKTGSNGKGTLVSLLRNLCGAGSWTSIPINEFEEDFKLQPLLKVNAVLVDENKVDDFLDDASNFKAIVTGDPININRKFKTPVTYCSKVFIVQCINFELQGQDKSESFYRRLLVVPMNKRFFGAERKYIKHDYLKRKDVLEYALLPEKVKDAIEL